MGIAIARNCCQGDSDPVSDKSLDSIIFKKSQIIRQDYQHFKEDKWFRFQTNLLFDTNKFIFLYPDYHTEQEALTQTWKKINIKKADFGSLILVDEVMSPRWKYAIRKGVPLNYYKSVIGLIFNRNFDSNNQNRNPYFNLKSFKDQDNSAKRDLFGIEGISGKVRQYVHGDFLNDEGFKSLQTILYAIQIRKGQMMYNQYILHLVPLMLIFLQQEQVFETLSILIDHSTNQKSSREASLRWHFTLTESQMNKLADNFYSSMKDKSFTITRLLSHFSKCGIEGKDVFREVIENFFYGFLPFPLILKIFLLFLNEGVKTFHRIFYSLLKLCLDQILQVVNMTNIISAIKKKGVLLNSEQGRQFLKVAYTIRLNKYTHSYGLDSSVDSEELMDSARHYMPVVKGGSQILSFNDLDSIWEYLPDHLKNQDAIRKFPDDNNKGKSLNIPNLIFSMKPEMCGFIVIQTQLGSVFGIFLASWLKAAGPKQYYGSSENFLFQIYPQKKKYSSSAQNIYYCFTPNATECKFGGGGEGPALEIKFDLGSGLSFRSDTYKNQPLHAKDTGPQFKIKKIQVFQLY